MRIDCQIHRDKGMPLVTPVLEEVQGYHCAEGHCYVDCASGRQIHLTGASVHHANSIPADGFVMGLSIHGLESCPEFHGASVAQELWLRARD